MGSCLEAHVRHGGARVTETLGRLYDELRAYKRSRALAVALSSGIFDALRRESGSAAHVAKRCGLAEDWTAGLLELLRIFGLVVHTESHWELTAFGERAGDDPTLRAFAGYHLHCYAGWQSLPERCQGAAGPGFHAAAAERPEFINAYVRSMDTIAQQSLAFLQDHCRLAGTVLDVGAGPSTVCRYLAANGRCEATALDLPAIVEAAKALFSFPDGFQWIVGDFRDFVPERPFDAVYCSHLLEYASLAELPEWLARMRAFTRPGGEAAFLIFLRDSNSHDQLELTVFELSTGVNGTGLGRICTSAELRASLQSAGAEDIEFTPLPRGPSYSEYLVTCTWT